MPLRVRGIDTREVERLRCGGHDANGQPPVCIPARAGANPCRHCLGLIPDGEDLLVLSHRPFQALQPYAEAGPIFLHRRACTRYDADALPDWCAYLDPAVVRGYGLDHWIRYDTGRALPGRELTRACEEILADPTIAYVHVRSQFGCYQCRVDRRDPVSSFASSA